MDVASPLWENVPAATWRDRWRVPDVILLARTASTNDVARRLADAGAPAGTVVIADEQTAGRGRFGREWIAPPGCSLLLSIVLRPGQADLAVRLPSTASIRVGLAAARAIEAGAGVKTALKWPNDLIIPGRGKVAGILCEGSTAPDGDPWVVAGIGINIGQTADDFPEELRAVATSIRRLTGRVPSRAAIAGPLLDALRPYRLRDLRPLQPDELQDYVRRDALRGQHLRAEGESGIADGIAADGALRLLTRQGIRFVRSGSVRPATDSTDSRLPLLQPAGTPPKPEPENCP
ncbi:MAG: biotin--[acetyl-CoA-carboxylase] ligase [Longimicrobiales bacterium]